jgi:hypothetical protein
VTAAAVIDFTPMQKVLKQSQVQEPGPFTRDQELLLDGHQVDRAIREKGQDEPNAQDCKKQRDDEPDVLPNDVYNRSELLLFDVIAALCVVAVDNPNAI